MHVTNWYLLSGRAATTLVGWLRQHVAGTSSWLQLVDYRILSAEAVIRLVSHLPLDESSSSNESCAGAASWLRPPSPIDHHRLLSAEAVIRLVSHLPLHESSCSNESCASDESSPADGSCAPGDPLSFDCFWGPLMECPNIMDQIRPSITFGPGLIMQMCDTVFLSTDCRVRCSDVLLGGELEWLAAAQKSHCVSLRAMTSAVCSACNHLIETHKNQFEPCSACIHLNRQTYSWTSDSGSAA